MADIGGRWVDQEAVALAQFLEVMQAGHVGGTSSSGGEVRVWADENFYWVQWVPDGCTFPEMESFDEADEAATFFLRKLRKR
jgi:hypothetical protein